MRVGETVELMAVVFVLFKRNVKSATVVAVSSIEGLVKPERYEATVLAEVTETLLPALSVTLTVPSFCIVKKCNELSEFLIG